MFWRQRSFYGVVANMLDFDIIVIFLNTKFKQYFEQKQEHVHSKMG